MSPYNTASTRTSSNSGLSASMSMKTGRLSEAQNQVRVSKAIRLGISTPALTSTFASMSGCVVHREPRDLELEKWIEQQQQGERL